jgi:hypothetical protein
MAAEPHERRSNAPENGRPAQRLRPLVDIYCELGEALLAVARELRAGKETAAAAARYSEAAQAFERGIREGRASRGLLLGLAKAREGEGRREDAARACLEVVYRDPAGSPEALDCVNGWLSPDLAKAIGAWVDTEWTPHLLALRDIPPGAYAFLGRTSLYRRKYDKAVHWYHMAIAAAEPDDVFSLEGLGAALLQMHDAESAVSVLERAVEAADRGNLSDRSISTRRRLADALIKTGQSDAAITVLQEALTRPGGLAADVLPIRARALLGAKRVDDAEVDALRALELLSPLNQAVSDRSAKAAEAYAVLAEVALQRSNNEAAVLHAETALTFDSSNLYAICIEGQALVKGANEIAETAPEVLKKLAIADSLSVSERAQALIDYGIRLLRHYLDELPQDTEHRLLLASVLRTQPNRQPEALEVLEAGRASSKGKARYRLLLELAELAIGLGDTRKALLALIDGDSFPFGDEARWWHLRGDVHVADARAADALQAYEHALAAHQRNNTTPAPGLALKIAVNARATGNEDRAWAIIDTAIETAPADDRASALTLRAELASAGRLSGDPLLDAWYRAGRELYFASRLDQAREWLERVVKTKEDYLDAKWYRLDTLRRLAGQTTYPFWDAGQLRQARELWVDAVARGAPQQDAAWAFITGALLADGEGQLHPATARSAFSWEALTYLERALLLDDKNQYAWIHISRQHRSLGNYGNTAVATEEAFALAPDDLEVLDERLALRGDKGDTPGAKELLDERLRRDPSTWAQGVKAYVHNLEGNLLQAVDQVTLVMESEPDDLWNRTFRCDCLRQLAVQAKDEQQRNEYWKRAYADCEWILEKRGNPNYTSQELTFAAAAQALGRIDLAIELVSPLLPEPLDPSGNSHRLLGCCFLQRGEIEPATRHLERGIDGATSFANLKVTRDVWLAEIEARCSGWPHEAEVRRLLPSLYDRIDKAYSRVAAPSPEAELRRALEWDASGFPGAPWAHAAAAAGLARLATRAGRWSDAAQAYRSLSGDPRLPEAGIGAKHVAERAAQGSKASSV